MTPAMPPLDPPENPGDDALAAEFVLGVQEAEERARMAERVAAAPVFAARVAEWEARLSGLNDAFDEEAPPPALKAEIDRAVFGATPPIAARTVPRRAARRPARGSLWDSAGFWRLVSAGAVAALVLVLVRPPLPGLGPLPGRDPAPQLAAPLVASLTGEGDLSFLAVYDPGAAELRLRRTAGEAPPDRSLELWLIAEDGVPQSLGILPDGAGTAPVPLAETFALQVGEGVTFALTSEPLGGSPVAGPTGPVVAAGEATEI